MPTNEKKWGHARLRPEIWNKMKEIIAVTRRSLTSEVNLALEEYKPKKAGWPMEKATPPTIQQSINNNEEL
jgi:hypothetical protein